MRIKPFIKRCAKRILGRPLTVVTLTSYPPRMQYVAQSIQTVLDQTMPPDLLYLWLINSDFPNGLADLPEDLLALRKKGLRIRFADEDLKVHNKYFWTWKKHHNDIIITVDDDVLYRKHMIARLKESHRKHPKAISAMRAHQMRFDDEGNLLPYQEWVIEYTDQIDVPRMDLFATGVCGVLYPPNTLDSDIMTLENIRDYCIEADDIWLKIIELHKMLPVVVCSDEKPTHKTVSGSQEEARYWQMKNNGGNDVQMDIVLAQFNELHGKDDTLLARARIREEETGPAV